MGAAAHLAADQPGLFQCLDVLGGRRQRDRVGLGQLSHRALAIGEVAQHAPARVVAEGVEDGIQGACLMFNHVVEYPRGTENCQLFG